MRDEFLICDTLKLCAGMIVAQALGTALLLLLI